MVGRLLVGFVWLNLQFSVSWLVDFQWDSCGSIFSFLFHGRQTFSGVRVAQSLVFCVMIGRLLVVFVCLNLVFCVMVCIFLAGFVCLNLQFSASWLGDFQWGSCGSNISFLCHGRQTFSGVRVAQSLIFCVMVGRLLVGFERLNLQFSGSRQATFNGVRVAQSLVFCVMVGRLLVGFERLNLQFSGSRQATFNGVRVAQSLVFCVMVGRLLVGFVWLNLQFSVSWQVDFQWGSCGLIFSFLCHGWQTFSGVCVALQTFNGVRVSQSSFLCHGWQTFSGVRVAQSLDFCVMLGRLLVGFVWPIFSFLCHGWQTFIGVRVAQSLVFCVMVGRHLVGFVWLNLQFSVARLVDFQWGSCVSIFSFLCHGRQTFSGVRVVLQTFNGVRVSQSSFLCHGLQTLSGVRVALALVFCVMVGRLLGGFVWLNLQISVSCQVDFQWVSCVSIFSFLCHDRQTFWWVSCGSIFSFLCHGRYTFSGVRVAQSLVFCVMIGRLLVGFVWLNLQISVSLLVDFQWGSCVSIQFSVSWLVDFQWDSCGSIFSFLCHGWQTLCGVRVAQYLVFCVMVGRILVGFVWLNLQFSVSWLVDFYWGSCGSIFSLLCHDRQTFSGVRVAESLVFCVMVGRHLVGFVWLNLQLSASWLVDFQWGSCSSIFSFLCHGRQTFSGFRVAQSFVFCVMVGRLLVGFVWPIFSVLCHGWQTFIGVRVAQSLVFCVMVGRHLVGFVWLNLQISVSWLVDFQWGSCGSIFCFLCQGCHLLVGFVWLNLQFSVSWLVDFQGGSCGSIFSFLRHGSHTFSRVRVSQSLVFCVMVG